jgi:polygalacturonase
MHQSSFYPNILAQLGGKVLNMKELGAKGDGLADDTSAIHAAINAAAKGATIYFPAGIYIVSNLSVKDRTGLSFVGGRA